MIYILAADTGGLDSIWSVLQSGKVAALPCSTFQEFDRHAKALYTSIVPAPRITVGGMETFDYNLAPDTVILDTITSQLDTTRMDATIGTDPNADLWDMRRKYLKDDGGGDKNYLAKYDMAQNFVFARLKNIYNRGARIIVLAHEAEVKDPLTGAKVQGPQVNPAAVGPLLSRSSDVFRLEEQLFPQLNEKNEIIVPVGERILWLRKTPNFIAKFHVEIDRSESIKAGLTNPTLPKLYEHLGKKPSWLTVYGPPGSGKTTFAVSDVDRPKKQEKHASQVQAG